MDTHQGPITVDDNIKSTVDDSDSENATLIFANGICSPFHIYIVR